MGQPLANPLSAFLRSGAATPGEPRADRETGASIDRILDAVRSHLGMEVAFASHIHDGLREFTHISADIALPVSPGDAEPLEETLCHMVLAGDLPELIHDARTIEQAMAVPIVPGLPVASHLNVPLRLSNGELYGTFCCVSRKPDWSLTERDLATMRAFAQLAGNLLELDLAERQQFDTISARIAATLADDAITILHQPIHDLRSGQPVGVECLARFADTALRGPDTWFAEASQVGLGAELEMLAVRSALRTLPFVPQHCYMAINVSPDTVISGAVLAAIAHVPPGRLVVEVTEHDQVTDYAALLAALEPIRAHARIAIDDVGAGYSGLRHLVDLRPDILKLDMSLTRDIDDDAARRALAHAMVRFAAEVGGSIVAEGVETAQERETLMQLGLKLAQGYFFSRPMPVIAAQQLLLGWDKAEAQTPRDPAMVQQMSPTTALARINSVSGKLKQVRHRPAPPPGHP